MKAGQREIPLQMVAAPALCLPCLALKCCCCGVPKATRGLEAAHAVGRERFSGATGLGALNERAGVCLTRLKALNRGCRSTTAGCRRMFKRAFPIAPLVETLNATESASVRLM